MMGKRNGLDEPRGMTWSLRDSLPAIGLSYSLNFFIIYLLSLLTLISFHLFQFCDSLRWSMEGEENACKLKDNRKMIS